MPTALWKDKTKKQKRDAYEAVKRWRAKNKGQFNAEARLAIHLRRSIAFQRAWPLIVEHYGNRCLNCGASDRLCFDHVVPLSQGGENQLANGQPLCRKCNTFKGTIEVSSSDWRPDKGAWIAELVALNPHLVIRKAGKRFRRLALAEQKGLLARQDEAREREIVMPGQKV